MGAAAASGPATQALAGASWQAWGTSVVLRVTAPARLAEARTLLAEELAAIDLACSRFRADSELARVNAAAGGPALQVSPLFVQALQVALRAAYCSDGDVDPASGAALVLAGYDRDFAQLEPAARDARIDARTTAPMQPGAQERPRPVLRAEVRRGWRAIELDATRGTVRLPRGVVLDLGASAKAWAADRAAEAIQACCDCGVLVGVGGDIATAGRAPAGDWQVHVTDDHRAGPQAPGQTVAIASGGLATSSTVTRRWQTAAGVAHHIIDPARGAPVRSVWRTVSVAAGDCVDANIASTTALIRGTQAPRWLAAQGLPARLVDHVGRVLCVGDWPREDTEERRRLAVALCGADEHPDGNRPLAAA